MDYYRTCGSPEIFEGEDIRDAHQRCALNAACAKQCVRVSCQSLFIQKFFNKFWKNLRTTPKRLASDAGLDI